MDRRVRLGFPRGNLPGDDSNHPDQAHDGIELVLPIAAF
jgi:hypothetical protein